MAKRIIMIHGRGLKCSPDQHRRLWRRALEDGVGRAVQNGGTTLKQKIDNGSIKLDIVYYGDILNSLLSVNTKHKKRLTVTGSDGNSYVPHASVEAALNHLAGVDRFTKAEFKKLTKTNPLLEIQDDLATILSFVTAVRTLTIGNHIAIANSFRDLRKYFRSQSVGSSIRKRLHDVLDPALEAGDDILLISHSMGCIVAYDVMWKVSRRSEYSHLQGPHAKISNWITIGSPLGEVGVRNNLIDAGKGSSSKFPNALINRWTNIAAEGDFIAHKKKMCTPSRFESMQTAQSPLAIKDMALYNCYVEGSNANPHKAYGYLAHGIHGLEVYNWMNS